MTTLQPVKAFADQGQGLDDRREHHSPWLTTDEAATYLRYTGKHRLRSLYRFLERKGIPIRRRGARSILVARVDLDRALKGK